VIKILYKETCMRKAAAGLLLVVLIVGCKAGDKPVNLKTVEWQLDGTTFSGEYSAGDTGMPAVIIFHQWMGLSDHERDVAERLGAMGYGVFVADVYGKGNKPANRDGAREIATSFYLDRAKLRSHAAAAVEALQTEAGSSRKIIAIGYCFGGSTVLELARSGSQIAGFVSLHGGLSNPNPQDDNAISAPVLVLHGASDSVVPMSDVVTLTESLNSSGKDFSVHIFSGAVHGFTHRHDSDRYNEAADTASWKIMLDFFDTL
jgi:dienelactone hydrolase